MPSAIRIRGYRGIQGHRTQDTAIRATGEKCVAAKFLTAKMCGPLKAELSVAFIFRLLLVFLFSFNFNLFTYLIKKKKGTNYLE